MKILKEVKMVLWSFIGLGDRNRANPPSGNPLVLLAIAFVLVVVLLVVVAIVAKTAAGS